MTLPNARECVLGARARPARRAASGDTVIVQGLLTDEDRGPDFRSEYCAVLTLRDGLIVHDQSYLDLRVWPNPGLSRAEWAALDVVRR